MIAPLAWSAPGMDNWLLIALVGLLFFGKRLPEVGKSLGKGIVEFKKGLKGIEDDVTGETPVAAAPPAAIAQANQHKFDPYTGQPIAAPAARFDPYTGQPLAVERDSTTATLPPKA